MRRTLAGAATMESWTYDGLARETRHNDSRGAATTTSYNAAGQVEVVTNAAGQPTTYAYYPATDPAAGRVASVTNATNKVVSYTYDLPGHVISVSGDAAYPIIYTYDSYGARATMKTQRASNETSTTTWVHDPATGLLANKIYQGQTELTPAWLYTYFGDGRIETRTSRRGVVTAYDYNGFGDLVSVVYSGDNNLTPHLTYAAHDRLGRPGSVTTGSDTATLAYDPYSGAESITYGDSDSILPKVGVVAQIADAAGRPTGFNVNLKTTSGDPPVEGWSTVHYNTLSYDPVLGHLSGVASDSGTTALSYYPGSAILRQAVTTAGGDPLRRETRVVDAAGRIIGMHTSAGPDDSLTTLATTGYVVDELGRRTSARREDGSTWIYGYNDRSEVISGSKHLPGTSTPLAAGQQFNYTYDDIGNRLTALSGGDASGANQRTTNYTTNALNQYSSIQNPRSLDVLVHAPEHEENGPNVTVTSTGNAVGTVIDQGTYHRAQVTSSSSDAQWAPVAVAYGTQTLSSGNLWLPAATVTPTYDDDGNMTCDGRWLNVWDGENRLVSQQNAVFGAPNLLLEFSYDHRGRRIAKKVTDLDVYPYHVLSNLRFAYDAWNMVAEFEAVGSTLSMVRSYTWGPDLSNTLQGAGGVGGLLAARSGTADFYPCFDGNGNVIAWSDSQSQVRQRFDFDPFGNVTTTENSATAMPDIPLGFSTKYTDTETGLVYYTGRYYIPSLGRWPSRDPIGERGGLNLCAMIHNNPICLIDVLGLAPSVDVKLTKEPGFRCRGNYLWASFNYKLSGLDSSKTYYLLVNSTSKHLYQSCDCKDKSVWEHENVLYGDEGESADFLYVIPQMKAWNVYGPIINQGQETNGNGAGRPSINLDDQRNQITFFIKYALYEKTNGFPKLETYRPSSPDGMNPNAPAEGAAFDNGFDYIANHAGTGGGYLRNADALNGTVPVANGKAIMDIHLNCCLGSSAYGGDYNTNPNIDIGENRPGQAYEVPNTTYMQKNLKWHQEWPK